MRKKSRSTKRTVNGEISPADPLAVRGDGAATSGAGVARKVAHLTPGERQPPALTPKSVIWRLALRDEPRGSAIRSRGPGHPRGRRSEVQQRSTATTPLPNMFGFIQVRPDQRKQD